MKPKSTKIEKRVEVDYVRFIMPKDHELQFPAMAVMQTFIHDYDEKMSKNDVSGGTVDFRLEYDVVMPEEDWAIFDKAGLVLEYQEGGPLAQRSEQRTHNPTAEGSNPSGVTPDMIVDMSDDRINLYQGKGMHACQVCGLLCGVGCLPLPKLRQVRPAMGGSWFILNYGNDSHLSDCLTLSKSIPAFLDSSILDFKDDEITGVIGQASRWTYLAAAMGLPVIEIVPEGRHTNWLSKWQNLGYRQVMGRDPVVAQIRRAMASVEEMLLNVRAHKMDLLRA